MPFVAGQKVRASQLNAGLPAFAVAAADTTVNNSTTFVNATGVGLAVEANALYAWLLYLAYATGTTPDLKVALTAPAGATGHWGFSEGSRELGYGTANDLTLDGADNAVILAGYIDTAATAGTLQLQFAQQTLNVSDSIVRTGTWLALFRTG